MIYFCINHATPATVITDNIGLPTYWLQAANRLERSRESRMGFIPPWWTVFYRYKANTRVRMAAIALSKVHRVLLSSIEPHRARSVRDACPGGMVSVACLGLIYCFSLDYGKS